MNQEQFPNVTFAPTHKPSALEKIYLPDGLLAYDPSPEDNDWVEDDWIIMWHNVRIKGKETAISCIKNDKTLSMIKVNPKYLSWFEQVIEEKPTWWEKIKQCLFRFFRWIRPTEK